MPACIPRVYAHSETMLSPPPLIQASFWYSRMPSPPPPLEFFFLFFLEKDLYPPCTFVPSTWDHMLFSSATPRIWTLPSSNFFEPARPPAENPSERGLPPRRRGPSASFPPQYSSKITENIDPDFTEGLSLSPSFPFR